MTGASGLLGNELCRQAENAWAVTGLHCRHEVPDCTFPILQVDISDFKALKTAMAAVRPDAVIHCAAVSDPGACEKDPAPAAKVNVDATVNLAGLCADREIPFLFTSTDLVFDGLHAPYREDNPVCPISHYGDQKARAELETLARHGGALVCRMPLMFGQLGGEARGALRGLTETSVPAREVKLFTDEYRTMASAPAAAAGLLAVLSRARGILHMGGPQRISRFDFGCLALEVFAPAGLTLVRSLQKDVAMSPRRPPDVSLDITKARGVGYSPPTLKEQVADVAATIRERRTSP